MNHPSFVRKVLGVDALTCVACGALMTLAAAPLATAAGLPQPLVFAAGASLFPVAGLFAWMSRSPSLGAPLLALAVGGNLAWVAASLAVLAISRPTAFGVAFVLAQAAAVMVFALLEARGLRRGAVQPA
jgi:hypothetical protein